VGVDLMNLIELSKYKSEHAQVWLPRDHFVLIESIRMLEEAYIRAIQERDEHIQKQHEVIEELKDIHDSAVAKYEALVEAYKELLVHRESSLRERIAGGLLRKRDKEGRDA